MSTSSSTTEAKWIAVAAIATLIGGIIGAIIMGKYNERTGFATEEMKVRYTQTAEAKASGLKPNNDAPQSVPFTNYPVSVYAYRNEATSYARFVLQYNENLLTDYFFEYTLPSDQEQAWAGLSRMSGREVRCDALRC